MPRKSHSGAGRPAKPPSGQGERLQKILASAGIGSRRECEQFIEDGRVEVDRKVVTKLGTRIDPFEHEIRVDGTALPRSRRTYFAVNKPTGVLCTNKDPGGRPRVIDLVDSRDRLFTVGRLDLSSEGLILVTNDGELANRLTHPRYGIEKVYRVRVAGKPTREELRALKEGVRLTEGMARVASVQIKKQYRDSADLEIVLNEGRNREIRRLLARVGHKVVQLKRIAMGPIRLGDLPTGAHRRLTPQELKKLTALMSEAPIPKQPKTEKPKRKSKFAPKRGKPEAKRSESRTGPKERTKSKKKVPPAGGTVLGYEPLEEKPKRTPRKKKVKAAKRRRPKS